MLGNAATVAQLLGVDPGGIISMIREAARTARQNKKDCEQLAGRVGDLAGLLPHLPQDQVSQRGRGSLHGALVEAYDLIISCQGRGLASQLWNADRQAERFRDVEKKIDACLLSFILISHIHITRRLDWYNNNNRQSRVVDEDEDDVVEFTLAEITAATNNFSVVLSDDGGGSDDGTATVYKGTLRNGQEVDVKRLNPGWRGAEDAFGTELAILSPLRHHHIVRLLGRCADGGERFVVTQHMPNGSLYDHLHGGGRRNRKASSSPSPVAASWRARVQVLLGAARGVEHLHRRAVPLVIHGGVTSSNILLDAAWAPRLAGFGAAVWRAAGVESQAVAPPPQAGAAGGGGGYADPEHCSTGRVKPASDVYSLGVVMLEALTGNPPVVSVWEEGRQAVVPMTLVSFALPSIREGRLGDVLDRRPALQQQLAPPAALQMVANTAARCLLLHGGNRPAIEEVVANLEQALEHLCRQGNL
ncbi:unnamed protein product [Urochloa humidicola]